MKNWCWNVCQGYTGYRNNNIQMTHVVHGSIGYLMVLISLARVESSISRKTLERVSQVTGCLRLPFSQSCRIFVLISSALSLHSCMMLSTLAQETSSKRIVPNFLYCVLISRGICWSSSPGLGSWAARGGWGFYLLHNINENNLN